MIPWVLACNFSPKEDTTEPEVVEGCSTEIEAPQPGGETADADPHQESYGADPSPFHVRYNWPARDPSQSASFLWRTDLDTEATMVEFGIGELTERAEGQSFVFGGSSSSDGVRIHEVRICGTLEPGTLYSYRVGGEGAWSATHQFTTPGEPGSFDTFRVAITGDSRGAYETWNTVMGLMDSHDPDFYMFSGDMVDSGVDQDEWDAWFEATGDVLAKKALIPAHGNHELLAVNYFAQFALPENEEWFSVLFGNLQLVSLNDLTRDVSYVEHDQVAYMDEVFSDTPDYWKLGMHHRSTYSTSTRHGSAEAVREVWAPAFERNGVHAVVSGHNHIYERSVPIREEQEVSEGVTYIVSGGAGAPLYKEIKKEWFGLEAQAVEHYVIADFGPDTVEMVVRDLAGTVIDSFLLEK